MNTPRYDTQYPQDTTDDSLLAPLGRRIDASCEAIGFAPPPVPVQMTFSSFAGRTSAMALTPPGRAAEVAEWIKTYGPAQVELGTGLAPKAVLAIFDQLPEQWATVLGSLDLRYVELRPEGVASLFVNDDRPDTSRFADTLPDAALPPRERKVIAGPDLAPLTARQYEVLSLAVAMGYYELPHKLNVRDLARHLGMSVGATSEIMRRGESLIINSYFDRAALEHWQSRHVAAMQDRARTLLVGQHGAGTDEARMLLKDAN